MGEGDERTEGGVGRGEWWARERQLLAWILARNTRQPGGEGAAFAQLALHREPAAVGEQDLARYAETQAGAGNVARFGEAAAVKAVKDMLLFLG